MHDPVERDWARERVIKIESSPACGGTRKERAESVEAGVARARAACAPDVLKTTEPVVNNNKGRIASSSVLVTYHT